nr:MAG TPA: hypothetical protein [Caudoviricetes sp.]
MDTETLLDSTGNTRKLVQLRCLGFCISNRRSICLR